MVKIVVMVLALSLYLYSKSLTYGVLNKHSFVLPKGKLQIKSGYLKVNDTIDVLNIKEKELGGSLGRFGSIGDMSGYDFEVRYGLTSNNSVFVNYQRWNVDYTDSTLKNDKIDILNRYNFLSFDRGVINSASIDVGFMRDSSSPLPIRNESLLNSMIKKINPSSNISLKDGSIVAGDTTLSVYDKNLNKIHPYLSVENLQSNTYYTRLIFGKKLSEDSLLDFYVGYKVTDIKTRITFYPNDISFIKSLASRYAKELNRREENLNGGFVYTGQFGKNIFEFNYEYNKIFRDSDVSKVDYNHIVEATISRVINKNFLIYVGGKLMLQQFNTDVAYLYNQYTNTQFDKKYGFAQVGIIYSY